MRLNAPACRWTNRSCFRGSKQGQMRGEAFEVPVCRDKPDGLAGTVPAHVAVRVGVAHNCAAGSDQMDDRDGAS